ncbi:MAG: HesA/MoeB/ThiF family protein, partial [Verrucomicrobiota bacterium]
MRLPGVGEDGQLRLKHAKVLIVGAGGLGSPAAIYLAAAGVGVIGLADPDKVETSNLHRQILHGFDTLGLPKTISAAETLAEINPGIKMPLHPEGLTAENALELVGRYDLVIDGADNFSTRFLVADACVLAGRPLIHGSV